MAETAWAAACKSGPCDGEATMVRRGEAEADAAAEPGMEAGPGPAAIDDVVDAAAVLVRPSPCCCCMIMRCNLRLLSRLRCTALLPHDWLQLLVLGLWVRCCEEGEAALLEEATARSGGEQGDSTRGDMPDPTPAATPSGEGDGDVGVGVDRQSGDKVAAAIASEAALLRLSCSEGEEGERTSVPASTPRSCWS